MYIFECSERRRKKDGRVINQLVKNSFKKVLEKFHSPRWYWGACESELVNASLDSQFWKVLKNLKQEKLINFFNFIK